MRRAVCVGLLVAVIACLGSNPEIDATGTWVGTITTEANVTTVVNEAGSVWGGTARLVEEASIGVESGAEEYLLGRIGGLAAGDERIYVLDRQRPAVRIYDMEGTHQFDIAPLGQGPGEFQRPDGIALASDSTLYVTDFSLQRLVSYTGDGAPWATVRVDGMYQSSPRVIADGTVFVRVREGSGAVSDDGTIGRIIPTPAFDRDAWIVRTAPSEGFSASGHTVPFAPGPVWTLLPSGAIAQVPSGEYRIDLEYPDGSLLRVERQTVLVTVGEAEKAWHESFFRASLQIGWGPVEGSIRATPDTKPAVSRLVGAKDGSLWAVRQGPGVREAECADSAADFREMRAAPCWQDSTLIDAFGADGRYLGNVELPDWFRLAPAPVIDGERVVAAFEDEAGTIMVKRYRLVLPGEEGG